MQELLVEQYRTFSDDIHSLTFLILQQRFAQQQDPLERMIGSYVPQLHHYQPPIDHHKKQQVSLKKTPAFNHKKQFDNTDNLHRSVIDIFKAFILSQFRDFREYLRLTVDIDHLSHMLSKIEALRFNSRQFNLVFYLFTCSKRAIRIYLKLREQIIKQCTFTSSQYLPISTHNSAKYKENYHYLDGFRLSRQKWQSFINVAGFQFDSQFVFYLLGARNQVPAVELIEYCLWLNKQTASQTQSPTKKYEK